MGTGHPIVGVAVVVRGLWIGVLAGAVRHRKHGLLYACTGVGPNVEIELGVRFRAGRSVLGAGRHQVHKA